MSDRKYPALGITWVGAALVGAGLWAIIIYVLAGWLT